MAFGDVRHLAGSADWVDVGGAVETERMHEAVRCGGAPNFADAYMVSTTGFT
jgi:hypothetical protein